MHRSNLLYIPPVAWPLEAERSKHSLNIAKKKHSEIHRSLRGSQRRIEDQLNAGVVMVKDENTFDRLRVGSRVRVLANHSCLTAAQHSYYNVLEGENIGDRWKIHTGW